MSSSDEKAAGRGDSPVQDNDTHPDSNMSVGRYLATRLPTLKPPMHPVANPFSVLRLLNAKQWTFFMIGFLGWTWDAFDFFTVSLTATELAEAFDVSNTDITWGITLVLMLRSVGAILFGVASDRYGRKWPYIVNMVLFIVLELATGFCNTFQQFLGVRALYGIAMGGLYGNATATALEDCPPAARGILSGMLQQGYAFGYLLATVFYKALVGTTPYSWRPLYWFGACPPVLLIVWRYFLPETDSFIERREIRHATGNLTGTFVAEGRVALRRHWKMLIYLVLLMTGFNFMSHGSQDLYPTMLKNQYEKNSTQVTIIQVVANLGAMCGGTTVGYLSQKFGRRFSIIIISILGGLLLYPYSYTANDGIIAAAFFEQFCVQGAWGVIPIHLMELSPGSFRTFVVGTSYQLGNLVSSASSTIEASLGERFPLPTLEEKGAKPVKRYEYGKVICIFMACVYIYVIILTFFGPEWLGRNFDVKHDVDIQDAAHVKVDDEEKRSSNEEEHLEKAEKA